MGGGGGGGGGREGHLSSLVLIFCGRYQCNMHC